MVVPNGRFQLKDHQFVQHHHVKCERYHFISKLANKITMIKPIFIEVRVHLFLYFFALREFPDKHFHCNA